MRLGVVAWTMDTCINTGIHAWTAGALDIAYPSLPTDMPSREGNTWILLGGPGPSGASGDETPCSGLTSSGQWSLVPSTWPPHRTAGEYHPLLISVGQSSAATVMLYRAFLVLLQDNSAQTVQTPPLEFSTTAFIH